MMSTWTLSVCHGPADRRTAWQRRMRLIFLDRSAYGMATAHASHFFARGSVCYCGYSLSSEQHKCIVSQARPTSLPSLAEVGLACETT